MKKLHTLLFLLFGFISYSSFSADYYWVGGTGNWSDFANHWATTSGGSTFHTQAPTSVDNVYFNANSFNSSGQVVTINVNAYCNNFIWTGVTNTPTIEHFSTSFQLHIYGSTTLSSNATYDFRTVNMLSSSSSKAITSNANSFGSSSNIKFNGSGSWTLQDAIEAGTIVFNQGTFNSNNNNVTCTTSFTMASTGTRTLNMGSSEFIVERWANNATNLTLNSGTSIITTPEFYGDIADSGPYTYYNLNIKGSTSILSNTSTFNLITFDKNGFDGSQTELESGATFTATSITAQGTGTGRIYLTASTTGTEATLSVSSGTIDGEYLYIKDVHATGGATFNAAESIDGGNSTGWNITTSTTGPYYWVGGSGDWSDVNHWATSTGGSTKHTQAPGPASDVYFNNSSFSAPNQVVTIDVNAECYNIDWYGGGLLGVTNSPTFNQDINTTLSIYASIELSDNATYNFKQLSINSNASGETITSNGNSFGSNSIIDIEGSAGWSIADNVEAHRFNLIEGDFSTNSHKITAEDGFYITGTDVKTVSLGASEVLVGQWDVNTTNLTLNTESSYIETNHFFGDRQGDGPFNYWYVYTWPVNGTSFSLNNTSSIERLTVQPGQTVVLEAGATFTIYNDGLFLPGTNGSVIALLSSSPGNEATLNMTAGTVNGNYLNLTDVHATGGANFLANNSIDNGNNTGWDFGKDDQTITFGTISDKLTTSANFSLSASASSGLAVSYESSNTDVATVSGSTVTVVGVGSTTITASQVGNGDYNAAPDVEQSLTVNKADQTISFGALSSKSYGAASFDLTATTTSGLTVSYQSSDESVATISGNTVTIVGAGATTITASQAGNSTYNAASDVPQELTVNKVNQLIINYFALADKTFGDANYDLTASATSGLTVSYESSDLSVATVSGNTVTIVGAGSTIITASQAGDGNHNAAPDKPQTLTVNKASQTITFESLTSKTFGDADFALTGTSSSGLSVSYESSDETVATVSGNTVTIVGGGSTTITASQSGNTDYSAAANVPQSLTINKASQSITFGSLASKTFGDTDYTLTGTASSGLSVSYQSSDETVATVSGNTITIVGAGSTTITASQAGDTDYNAATNIPQTLTINKASQSITFGALASKTFGDGNFVLTGTASSGLTVSYQSSDETVATISGSTVTIVGAGSTTITASQAGHTDYYAATNIPQTLTIDKANQTITFGALASKTYGDVSYSISGTASSGLDISYASSNELVATVSGNTITIVGAGSTSITASQTGDTDYNAATNVPQTLTINKADQIITIDAIIDKQIDAADFDVVANSTSGGTLTYAIQSGPATISGATVSLNGTVGTVIVEVSQVGTTNYNSAFNTTSFAVNDPSLQDQTITFAAPADKTYDDADFDLTLTASSGLLINYVSSNLSVATISGNTVTVVGVGSTIITASQDGDDTFNPAPNVERTLTVNKADQTINIDAIADKIISDAAFDVVASASSGLTIDYAISGPASISGATITLDGSEGTVTITASQEGDSNYNAAADAEVSFSVTSTSVADQTITFDALADKLTIDSDFELTATATSGLEVSYVSSDEKVATISGSTVTIVGAGTTTITASQAGDASYNSAPDVAQTLTVNKADQSITFNVIADQLIEDGSFALSATATSGLDVSYEIVSGPATVVGNVVSFTGLGTVTIKATQAGNDSFLTATPVEQSFEVISITRFDTASKTSIRFYPNPVIDYISVESIDNIKHIEILNMSGQQMINKDFNFNQIDVSHLKSGNYIIGIKTDKQVFTNQIIKQ